MTLEILDVQGRRVAALAHGSHAAGRYVRGWDLRDHMLIGIHLDYWGNLLVGLGWVGAILLLLRRGVVPHAIVAVGADAKDRAAKLIRILPPDRLDIGPDKLRPYYQRKLFNADVHEAPPTVASQSNCARGALATNDALATK